MNLSEIVSNVNAELHPATNIDVWIKRWANRGQKKFVSLANHNFSWMALNNLTLTTSSGVAEYALSPLVDSAKVIVIRETTSPRKIYVTTREQFLERVPNPTATSGDPQWAYLVGYSPVLNQPSSSSVLSFSSTTGDNAVVRIEGLNGSGVLIGEDVTLNGTTPVTTVNSYTSILGRGINGNLNGIVTITSNSGGVTVEVIGPRQRQSVRPKIALYPTPTATQTLYYDAYTVLPDISSDNDFPLIPEKYHDAIENYCLYRGYRHKKDFAAAGEAKQEFERIVMQAVIDDVGPQKEIVMQDYHAGRVLPEGNLPGNYPRG